METTASRIAMVCGLAAGLLLWPISTPADDARRGGGPFRSAQGQEVVNGSYSCDGTVYTDEQPASVTAGAFMSATSGITNGFFGTSQNSTDVPADLDAMAGICENHIGSVLAEVPSICALGPVERERGAFGNGSTVVARFDFSCQGTRDQVIGVIGGFSRIPLGALTP